MIIRALAFLTLPRTTHFIPGRERSERTRNPDRNSERASGFRARLFGLPRNDRKLCKRAIAILTASILLIAEPAFAASGREPAPAGALPSAPPQYTHFTIAELTRGFMALAFGSDLRIGVRPRGIRRFDHPIRVHVINGGSIGRGGEMARVVEDYARQVPDLMLTIANDNEPADIDLRLIDEKDFYAALEAAFGAKVARTFIARTNPQCMTSVKSTAAGDIVRSVSFIIVDKGADVFFDCAYHELLHAFGLSNHDQRNPWTTLNQKRMVGYLSVYDRALLTLLYEPRIQPGMTATRVRATLPRLIQALGLAAPAEGK
jgi:Protein of unknown function (DUF2927)